MFFVSQSTTLSAYRSSHEVEVLTSSPIELTRLLYKGALDAVEASRLHLAKGQIRQRTNAITKAALIIHELSITLDTERGGNLAVDLRELYDYMRRCLTRANVEQVDPPLAEVQSLLSTLYEAWNQINPPELFEPEDIDDAAEIRHSYSF